MDDDKPREKSRSKRNATPIEVPSNQNIQRADLAAASSLESARYRGGTLTGASLRSPRRFTGHSKKFEPPYLNKKPLKLSPEPNRPSTLAAAAGSPSKTNRQRGGQALRGRGTSTELVFTSSARESAARTMRELGADHVTEINSDHSSEDEVVARGTGASVASPVAVAKLAGRRAPPPRADAESGIRRTMQGFEVGYDSKSRLESVFGTVSSPSGKIVDRMRPKTCAPDDKAVGAGKEVEVDESATMREQQDRKADEIIGVLRTPPNRQRVTSGRRKTLDPGMSPYRPNTTPSRRGRRNSSGVPGQQPPSIPPKKLLLTGVQIGKHFQQRDPHAAAATCPSANLLCDIQYVQQFVEIRGLGSDDKSMRVHFHDMIAVDHHVHDGNVVLQISPKETAESVFAPDIFDPANGDPALREILLYLQLSVKSAESCIARLLTALGKASVCVRQMDADTFMRHVSELNKPVSIDLISSSDDEARPAQTRVAAKASSPVRTQYWSSLDNVGKSSASPSIEAASDSVGMSKRKSPVTPTNSTHAEQGRADTQKTKQRRTQPKRNAAPLSLVMSDSDEDDFVVQRREFRSDDETRRFVYPRGGPKLIQVMGSDISRLYAGEFLNDTILEFYTRYISETLRAANPALHEQCFFFNPFFFRKLSHRGKTLATSSEEGPMQVVYRQLQKWTASVELFDKRYIFVPINENTHWYLALITNPKTMLEDPGDSGTDAGTSASKSDANSQATDVDGKPDNTPWILDPNTAKTPGKDDMLDSDNDVKMKDAADTRVKDLAPESPAPQSTSGQSSAEQPEDTPAQSSGRTSRGTGRPKLAAVSVEFMGKTVEIPESRYLDPLSTPAIIILDSLGNRHPQTFSLLRGYIRAEANSRHGVELSAPLRVGKYAKVPLQNNFCDCGVYLLHYIEEFLRDPVSFVALALGGISMRDMFTSSLMQQKRTDILELATRLAREQAEPSPGDQAASPETEPKSQDSPAATTEDSAEPDPKPGSAQAAAAAVVAASE
ncbi:hypothetical protein GGF46_000436 [Coemansia sp. RSA 552]|nr:hypothetical protein GGF46_000436 [Coemansia sp. RSA 552]